MGRIRRHLSRGLFAGALALAGPGAVAVGQTVSPEESALAWRLPDRAPPDPIRPEEYAARRKALTDALGDGVYLALGARAPARDYLPYHQNPAFRYLVGIDEPDAALIMVRSGGRVSEWLFVQPRDPSREVWEGRRLGPEGARDAAGIPAHAAGRLMSVLDSLVGPTATLFALAAPPGDVAPDAELTYEQQVLSRLLARQPTVKVSSAARALSSLRSRKSPGELDRIRRATYLSAEAHRQAMRATEPGMNEFEIQALVEYVFRRHGADGPAYASIVGSGPNSTTLHYNANDRCMGAGEVLLFDVGASFGGYAADVTRTIPVNGTFTPEQRAIYEIVLTAQKAAERTLRPRATWQDLNAAANRELARGLAGLGLIDAPDATYDCGTPGNPRRCPQYRLFYMHGLGHGVGLEVHDPDISTTAGFQPGSAVTIEPGLYLRADALDYLPDTPDNRALIGRLRPALARYADIGVRIEDVYLVDRDGIERASRGVPREIDEVEALMRESTPLAAGRRADVVAWRCPPSAPGGS